VVYECDVWLFDDGDAEGGWFLIGCVGFVCRCAADDDDREEEGKGKAPIGICFYFNHWYCGSWVSIFQK